MKIVRMLVNNKNDGESKLDFIFDDDYDIFSIELDGKEIASGDSDNLRNIAEELQAIIKR